MTRTDHIIALVSATLTADEQFFAPALAKLSSLYEINEPRKVNLVSLGAASGESSATEPLAAWIQRLRDEKVSSVQCINYASTNGKMPAHIAASFAGTITMIIEISSQKSHGSYILRSQYSPRFGLNPEKFIELINAQTDPALAWARVTQLLLESNRLNQKTIFPEVETADYLVTAEGRQVFEYMVDNILKETQIELAINGFELVIPASLQPFFTKYDTPSFFKSDKEYVYLYPEQEVNFEQLQQIIKANAFGDRLWQALNDQLAQYNDEEFQQLEAGAWPDALKGMDTEKLNRIAHTVCRSICVLCEEDSLKPKIPENLAAYFGPDETNQKRAALRSKIDDSGWHLANNTQSWEYNEFYKISDAVGGSQPSSEETRPEFLRALKDIYRFATRSGSMFQEAFGLSLFVLGKLDEFNIEESDVKSPGGKDGKTPAGKFDLNDLNANDRLLKSAGFSERAIENLKAAAWIVNEFRSIGWSEDRLRDQLAMNISNVFGGMGSWNDQYFEKDQPEYDAVTAAFYEAFRSQFAAVLSFTK
ncbi:MAG: hypothetical protein EOO02_00325 [Chitinophagaceae bacterium]|nr:MAG: hypothetical protein EOO02_00325 [Chitinophagaceae bacterium]